MERFALSLHPDKTRLIEFGRFAATNRARRGLGKPETFDFLGFAHISGRSRKGLFQLKRKSRRDRMRAKLRAIKEELRRRLHEPIPQQGQWLGQMVRGYFAYHAVPTNFASLSAFRYHVEHLWRRALRRRSQKDHTTWYQLACSGGRLSARPAHPSSVARRSLCRHPPEVGARCVNRARRDLCGGCAVMRIPTAIGQCPIKLMRLRCKDRDRHSAVIGCSAVNGRKRETGRSVPLVNWRSRPAPALHLAKHSR